MQDAIIEKVNKSQLKKCIPRFAVGDKVSVFVRLKEGDKERTQVFRGVVIQQSRKLAKDPGATFTVRKVSSGIGVERVFPVHSPFIEKVNVESSSKVRQSRLFFLRSLKGKKARLKEKGRFDELVVPEPEVTVPDTEQVSDAEQVSESAGGEATTEEVSEKDPTAEKKMEQSSKTDESESPAVEGSKQAQDASEQKTENKS